MGSRWRRYADREGCVRRDYTTAARCSGVDAHRLVFPDDPTTTYIYELLYWSGISAPQILLMSDIYSCGGGISIPLCNIILCLNIDRLDGSGGCDLIRLGGVCERLGEISLIGTARRDVL